MDNGIDPKPNYLELDEERSKLLEKILLGSSTNARLDAYLNYFLKILSFKRSNIEEAFLSEFLDDYLNVVKRYEVWGNDPELTRKIFEQLLKIKDRLFTEDYAVVINNEIARLESQWTDLTNILNGIEDNTNDGRKAYFPVIDNEAPVNCYGLIESVTVRINKTDGEDKFIIIPSEKEIEQRIAEQIKISWQLALRISNKYVRKRNQYHEVIISFDTKAGFYVGNSLGIALTLNFLEQILKFYNPTYIIKISEGSAFTGGIDSEGNVLNTGEDIIKRKVAAIFYSQLNSFVIPKLEETYAYFALEQLKKDYPQRKLKLIPAEDIEDVLNRRDLVEVKKQKAIVRTGKFVRKNWISAAGGFFLTMILSFVFVLDFDNNPAILAHDGDKLFIKNINGKKLWDLVYVPDLNIKTDPSLLKYYSKIVDIDDDGINEVLVVNTAIDEKNKIGVKGTLICYDSDKNKKWEYTFRDTVYSERENLQPKYAVYLIDTSPLGKTKTILCFANNITSFTSAIFALELETGRRIEQTQWNSGYTWDALVVDMDENGEKEVVAIGADNGFNDGVIWCVELNKLNGFRPTTLEYRIKNFEQVDLIFYVRIPKTDYDIISGGRVNGLIPGSLAYNETEKEFRFASLSAMDNTQKVNFPARTYNLDINNMQFEVYMIDKFSSLRDSLVNAHLLSLPYTDTKEYKEILKSQILYFKDGKWVKREELN